MKLGPLFCGRKARRTQIVPRNFFQGARVRGAALEAGRGRGWGRGERCLMGRKEVKEAGWDEARTTFLW